MNNAKIKTEFVTVDEEVNIYPSFNYQYDKHSAWDFFKNYFLFTAVLRNTNSLENKLKGALMDWEIQKKGIVQHYKIPIKTCRYSKSINLELYPDVAWVFHAIFDDPYIPEYYNNNKSIKTVKGLEKEIDWIKNNKWANNFSATIIGGNLGSGFINDFLLDIIKDIADRYEMGFTAYYDFEKDGKINSQQIDYTETHPEVFKVMIASVFTVGILIDVLLIILTEGAALANFLSKAGKVAGVVNKGSRVAKIGNKAEDILAQRNKIFNEARKADKVKSTFELMKGYYFRGYRFAEDKDIGVQPVLEERVKISPLINLGVTENKTLGKLLVDKIPLGMVVNIGKSASGGFGTGISRSFTDRITYTNNAGKKIKIGKEAGAGARAAKYPLRVVNKGLTIVYDLTAVATDQALEKVFGAKGEFEKDITAHYDMDFWLKIHNKEKKLDLISLYKGESKNFCYSRW